jgi:hypothetical protein
MGDRRALVAREVRVDVDLRDRALTDEPMRMTPGIRRLKIKNPDYSLVVREEPRVSVL